jgi:hypothetical protein
LSTIPWEVQSASSLQLQWLVQSFAQSLWFVEEHGRGGTNAVFAAPHLRYRRAAQWHGHPHAGSADGHFSVDVGAALLKVDSYYGCWAVGIVDLDIKMCLQ